MEGFRTVPWLTELTNCLVAKVTEVTPAETENPVGGYGKTIEHVILGLKTTKGTKQLKLVRGFVVLCLNMSQHACGLGPYHL
jgi:RuvB-like protein 1 (pontin 52)